FCLARGPIVAFQVTERSIIAACRGEEFQNQVTVLDFAPSVGRANEGRQRVSVHKSAFQAPGSQTQETRAPALAVEMPSRPTSALPSAPVVSPEEPDETNDPTEYLACTEGFDAEGGSDATTDEEDVAGEGVWEFADARAVDALPVFVVLGTTGVGKSRFAIELARAVGGEIINADSMQVYKGLDIVTNKVTPAEREAAPHHLLDFVDPGEAEYSVIQFERDALAAIGDIRSRGRVPVLVGGTHYYIQAVLWDSTLVGAPEKHGDSDGDDDGTAAGANDLVAAHPEIPKVLAERVVRALESTDSRFRPTGGPSPE
ncbi:tRNA dimethylallyltransferase, partial [Cladochytrium tenue]